MRADILLPESRPGDASAATEPAWAHAQFETRLRERGRSYHIHYPFNMMLNSGRANAEQVRQIY